MSHSQQDDFADLERMDLSDDVKERVKLARIAARTVIEHLEPRNVWSWFDFLRRLEDAYQNARLSAQADGGVDIKEFDAKKR